MTGHYEAAVTVRALLDWNAPDDDIDAAAILLGWPKRFVAPHMVADLIRVQW